MTGGGLSDIATECAVFLGWNWLDASKPDPRFCLILFSLGNAVLLNGYCMIDGNISFTIRIISNHSLSILLHLIIFKRSTFPSFAI